MEYGNLDRKRPGSAAALNWVLIHCDMNVSVSLTNRCLAYKCI